LSQTIATDISNGIKGLIKGTSTLGDVINSVLDKMLDAAINMAMFGNLSGTLGGGGGFFGFLGGLFKKKPAPLPSGPIYTAANGGRIPGGRPSLVGERGPELFTPTRSGMITPNHALGGSTNVSVNVDASGSSVEGDAGQAEQLGEAISQAIQAELIQQKRPGGILYS
jgi:phage-related minor tail protein